MIRKQIYLEAGQARAIKQLASQTGMAEAELIRAAIDQHLLTTRRQRTNLAVWDAERAYLDELARQTTEQTERSWHRDELHER